VTRVLVLQLTEDEARRLEQIVDHHNAELEREATWWYCKSCDKPSKEIELALVTLPGGIESRQCPHCRAVGVERPPVPEHWTVEAYAIALLQAGIGMPESPRPRNPELRSGTELLAWASRETEMGERQTRAGIGRTGIPDVKLAGWHRVAALRVLEARVAEVITDIQASIAEIKRTGER